MCSLVNMTKPESETLFPAGNHDGGHDGVCGCEESLAAPGCGHASDDTSGGHMICQVQQAGQPECRSDISGGHLVTQKDKNPLCMYCMWQH